MYLCNGILLGSKKRQATDMYNDMYESQKYCMEKKKLHTDTNMYNSIYLKQNSRWNYGKQKSESDPYGKNLLERDLGDCYRLCPSKISVFNLEVLGPDNQTIENVFK